MKPNYKITQNKIYYKFDTIEICNYKGTNEIAIWHWHSRIDETQDIFNQNTVAIFKITWKYN